MIIDPYSALSQFIGCHFHEDYDLFGNTFQEIISEFKQTSSLKEIKQVCLEMDEFIVKFGPNFAQAFSQNWSSFDPAGLGYSIPEFFDELKRILNS